MLRLAVCCALCAAAAEAQTSDVGCEFSEQHSTAVSWEALASRSRQRTVVIELWGVAINDTAAGTVGWRDTLLAAVVGESGGWDAAKGALLPAAENTYSEVRDGRQYFVLNATGEAPEPFADTLTAAIPPSLFYETSAANQTIVCRNTFTIANVTSQVVSLQRLFSGLSGNDWVNSDGWGEDFTRPCAWKGVACNVNGSVDGLFLSHNGLASAASAAPAPLLGYEMFAGFADTLTELHLSGNPGLNSTLDALFPARTGTGVFPALRTLSLHSCALQGTLPLSVAELPSLRNLLLYRNELVGSIPDEYGNITSLSTLLLHDNRLSGTLPDWANPFLNSTARVRRINKVWAYGNLLNETHRHDDTLALEESAHPFGPGKYSNWMP